MRMPVAFGRNGKVYKEVDIGIHEERKKRIRDRIQYWKDVKAAALPDGRVSVWADKKIQMLEDVITEMDAQRAREAAAHEEEPENRMGAVGRAK